MTPINRREFLLRTALAAGATTTLTPASLVAATESPVPKSPIVVFSKVYQMLKLNYEESASLTSEAGLAGVDCTVRPAGEVLPERVGEDLPRYATALKQKGLIMPLITTAILGPQSPHAEKVLRAARQLGVGYYRIGFVEMATDSSAKSLIAERRADLKELAKLNKQLGLTALVQNHSPSGHSYLGGDLNELRQIVADFDPAEVGIAFDIGHAISVHGKQWASLFEPLKPHVRIIYVKDVNRQHKWVPFGEGEVGGCGYFQVLKELQYKAPISLHIEFDWNQKGKQQNRAALLAALRQSVQVLRGWLK